MKKSVFSRLTVLTIVTLLFGLAIAAPVLAKNAYFVGPMAGGAAWGQAEKGFLHACEELGWTGRYLAPYNPDSYFDMVNLAETAITSGADVLVINVTDVDMFADMLDRAKAAGIIIIGLPADDPDRCDAQAGTDPTSIGTTAAEALVRAIGDRQIHVATMQTGLTVPIEIVAREAFEERLLELAPDAVIVDRLDCQSNAAVASSKLSALKLARPELNSMMSINSYAGLGAAAFVEENGLKGEFVVLGMDDAPEILRTVQDGSMVATIVFDWFKSGYDAVMLANTIMEGGEYEYRNDTGARAVFAEDVLEYAEDKGIDLSN